MSLFKNKKVAIFTDIHIGIHKNSAVWHNVALSFCDWMIDRLQERGITDIIFCGDFYHTRHEIEQTTLDCGVKFLKKLSNFNIKMITGNHCCYFKHNSDVHSLSPFKEWGNITVYDKPTLVDAFSKKIMFCPWGTELNEIPRCDYVFGHFEIVNFKMNTFKVCDHGAESKDVLQNCNTVFSGHFHLRDIKTYEDEKTITYLGSPYEMDFGERGQDKGITVLDIVTGETEFVCNELSPRHKKITVTELLESPDTIKNLNNIVNKNFISIVVDKPVSIELIETLQAKILNQQPAEFRIEHSYTTTPVTSAELKSVGVDILSTIHEYIDILDITVSKVDICKKITSLYEKATQTT
jgi:DNA repair exonuclease SbcCD nuclease subunit